MALAKNGVNMGSIASDTDMARGEVVVCESKAGGVRLYTLANGSATVSDHQISAVSAALFDTYRG